MAGRKERPRITAEQAAGWTQDELDAASQREIEAGRLPLRAQWRIAEHQAGERTGYTSALSVDEFHALRGAGFEPVGQVMGAAVYGPNTTYGFYQCGWVYSGYGPTWASSSSIRSVPTRPVALREAWTAALDRMRAECSGLGGDGVIGVTLQQKPFTGGAVEYLAIGTAVRAIGAMPRSRIEKALPKPFTGYVTGHDFALLARSGWLPTEIVFGVSHKIMHSLGGMYTPGLWWGNIEMDGLTALVQRARSESRVDLAKQAKRAGGVHVVVRDMGLRQAAGECGAVEGAKDYSVQSTIWGTAVTPVTITDPGRFLGGTLQIMRLDAREENQ